MWVWFKCHVRAWQYEMEMEREQKLAERDLRTQKVWAQRLAKEMHQDIVSVGAKRESMQVSPSAPLEASVCI